MGVPRSERIRKSREFFEGKTRGTRIHCRHFVFQHWTEDLEEVSKARFGVVASRRVGNAVVRNRGKRRMRELFREQSKSLPSGSRVVVVLRSTIDSAPYDELREQFLSCCRRICHSLDKAPQVDR